MHNNPNAEFVSVKIAVLTVSDTRGLDEDTSGQYFVDSLTEAGHTLADRVIIPDDVYLMRAVVSRWFADPEVQAILMTGGTGFTERDSTPEAILPLIEKEVKGFGELFRQLSHEEIGSSTIQSRAIAGLTNNTVIFCMPGSTGACRTGWEGIVKDQLDARHRPCNFVGTLLKKQHRDITAIKPFCESRS